MISKDNYELVKRAIKTHSKLKDRMYLILYKVSAKEKSKMMETPILEENFWHLVGCKIDDSLRFTSEQKHRLYLDCLAGTDISNLLIYTRQPQDVSKKVHVINNLFDFISNAKYIRLCHTDGTPEAAMFRVGAGSNNGVIGYSEEEKGMIPKTAQQKSIFKIKADANDKIFPSIIEELPENILYEEDLFSSKMVK